MSTWCSIACPYCGAEAGEKCHTAGRALQRPCPPHTVRMVKAGDLPSLNDGTEYRTKTGKVLTDADIQVLADEAEAGYDVSKLKKAKKGKKGKKKAKK